MMSSNNQIKRGAFIVFEGLDKCGKSTQSSLLVKFLQSQNVPVKHMAFPDRKTPSGCLINDYLTMKRDMPDESIHLLFAVNRWEVQNDMKKLLNLGTTLVVDRYSYSGVAYSSAKGLNFDWCKSPEKGVIRPDLVFYLKTNIENLLDRGSFGEERYEKAEFQKKVEQIFNKIHETEKHYWKEVDASKDINSIHEHISSEALKTMDNTKQTPINLLWK